MALKLITAAATTPVSLAEAKAHLRVDHGDQDDLITLLIAAVTSQIDGADGWLNRALIEQIWELTLDRFPVREIKIPLPPLIEIQSVKYDDLDGIEQTKSSSTYTVDAVSQPGWLLPDDNGWPDTFCGINTVRIRFRAGYGTTGGTVPGAIRAWLLLNIGTLYEFPESVVKVQSGASIAPLPPHVLNMLSTFRAY